MNMRHSILQLDSEALQHNFNQIKKLAPQSKILAMIKSNAYGHGLLWAANNLKQADGLGVAVLADALELRKNNISQKIVLLRGVYNPEELKLIQEYNIDIVVHNYDQVKLILENKNIKNLNIWLKINTGMNRLGFEPHEAESVYEKLKNFNIILITHFACADELDKPSITQKQIDLFNQIKITNIPKSLAHSAGILAWKDSHADWVRPGLILYGVSPLANKTGLDFNLKPAMTWQSELIAVRNIKKGEGIGYNHIYKAPEDMKIGVVGVGYGLGYPRHAKNGTPILINNIQTEVIGRVSMEMLMINLNHIPDPKIGDVVTLWGKNLPIEKVAAHTATSAYELLCHAPV